MTGPNIISCASNPYDLRPAVEAIGSRIFPLLQKDDSPLYLLMCEKHRSPAHIILRQALIENLLSASSPFSLSADNLAYGTEREFTMMEWVIRKKLNIELPEGGKGKLAELDTNGKRFLQTYLSFYFPVDAPNSIRHLFRYLATTHISFGSNDAPMEDNDEFLDMTDTLSDEIASKILPGTYRPLISPESVEGMYLRNIYIKERATIHSRNNGATRIYVQDCGDEHLFGNAQHSETECNPYAHSLANQFLNARHKTLAVLLTNEDYHTSNLPDEEAHKALATHGILIEGLDSSLFNRDQSEEEKNHIRKIHQSSSEAFTLYDDFPVPNEKNKDYQETLTQIPLWIAETTPK